MSFVMQGLHLRRAQDRGVTQSFEDQKMPPFKQLTVAAALGMSVVSRAAFATSPNVQ